jgi:hypothetical protein
MWAATTTNGRILYEPANGTIPYPAVPSVIVTVTQIA